MDKKEFEIARYKFIILGLVCYIIMILVSKFISNDIIENILSTLGGLFIITGIFDIWLRKVYINDLSTHIINGFFTKENILQNLRTEDITNSIKNMIIHLSLKLHESIRIKFQNRVLKYFVDIFNSSDNESLNTFYDKYSLAIVMKKRTKQAQFVETNYELSYTLVNNIEDEVIHKLFKIRGMEKEFVQNTKDVLVIKKLEVEADNKKINFDISKLKTKIVDIPTNASINNRDKVVAITIRNEDNMNEEIKVSFLNKLKVTKKITVKTKLNDIIYTCHFNRVASNIDINFVDENAKNIHVLSGFAFIDKENIDITDIQDNNKKIKVNDLIFPEDKINFISER